MKIILYDNLWPGFYIAVSALALMLSITLSAFAHESLATGKDTVAVSDEPGTILAIGAHAGDMEVSCGAVLAKHAKMGNRVIMLHLTLGERGHPEMSPDAYADQKKQEAENAAEILGSEVIFGPYSDAEIPDNDEARNYVSEIIRKTKPTHVITHWKNSIHKDHSATHSIVTDAVLLASLEGIESDHPRHRGVRGIYFTENWEDMEGFEPYIFVDVSGSFQLWKEAVAEYEFIVGDISTFPYFEYYSSLATVRGALARSDYAVTFDIDPFGKRQTLDYFP
ncbi:PIG-L deacetylase family protein [Natronogracilivirga saccharolytica]|uniref:PIG-L family deacetylase n=1 Tax=Natronogracilivirga saccharolytica TaxID=2812953 RepID=A0A8J7UVZ7_9BACT|nr:PIG-L family deacetylase [Natronogracilivirga saccharolytica]MBP3191679.1 PIG-L family deacetylase [Natronogracilivirga saccharolytica]